MNTRVTLTAEEAAECRRIGENSGLTEHEVYVLAARGKLKEKWRSELAVDENKVAVVEDTVGGADIVAVTKDSARGG